MRHTYTISPTVVNSLLRRATPGTTSRALRRQNGTTPQPRSASPANFVARAGVRRPADRSVSTTAGSSRSATPIQGPQARVSENFQIQDAVSWVAGDHRFKFGFDGTLYRQDQAFLFVNQGTSASRSRTCGGNTTGDDFADFLIGNSPATSSSALTG